MENWEIQKTGFYGFWIKHDKTWIKHMIKPRLFPINPAFLAVSGSPFGYTFRPGHGRAPESVRIPFSTAATLDPPPARTARPGKHTTNYGKSPFLMGKATVSMAIFNSYD